MQYLDPSEYVAFGLSAETSDGLVTAASALIDSVCKRPSLGVTQYVERLPVRRGGMVPLSYAPLAGATPVVSVRVRTRRPPQDFSSGLARDLAVFTANGAWLNFDLQQVNVTVDGYLSLQPSLLGGVPVEVEVTYTAGYEDVPVPVKIACAQIVRNAQATPALNVRRQAVDSLQMEYFSGTLLDGDVLRLLQPYVAERAG